MNGNIGIDIVDVEKIEKIYEKHGSRFLEKIFNPEEIDYIKEKNNKIETIAGMYSFKESISKALQTGITGDTKFKDIKIYHTEEGAPYGKFKDKKFKLSSSHDGGLVFTMSVLDGDVLEIPEIVKEIYKVRPDKSHKSTFGKAMIIAGSKGMIGAGFLSSTAALKSGCGLTYHYVFPDDDIFLPLSVKHVEVILRDSDPIKDLKDMKAVLFGPGVGKSRTKRELLSELLSRDINLVLDADGLNMLSEDLSKLITKKAKVILTPHILEFNRLIGELIPPGDKLFSYARDFAKVYNLVLVLKDSKTYITDGENSVLVDRENSGMATAGSGDVLAGIITSFLAQGYEIYDAALLGVYIHSLAGEVASKNKSKTTMIARDIIDGLDSVFRELEKGI